MSSGARNSDGVAPSAGIKGVQMVTIFPKFVAVPVSVSRVMGTATRTLSQFGTTLGIALLVMLAVAASAGRARAAQSLDHFLFYGTSPIGTCSGGATPGAACASSSACGTNGTCTKTVLRAFGPIQLTDQFRTADYNVGTLQKLGLPADKNAEGVFDANTHLRQYNITRARGTVTFPKTRVRVFNQCTDALIDVISPSSILLPANKSLTDPVPAPNDTQHAVDHFLCYNVAQPARLPNGTPLPRFPKGTQVEVADQFQTRRYDLKKITRLCNPVAKQEDPLHPPVVPPGTTSGIPKPITPAAIRNPSAHLVCYLAALATRHIAQTGCGATNPIDRGTPISPRQPASTKRIGVYVNDQFGPGRVNTRSNPLELCIPSSKSICGNNVAESPEACDGTDNAACDGLPCRTNCTCQPATCGNNIQEGSAEACDGTDNAACGGLACRADCSCTPPSCGDQIKNQANEDCDGTDDAACPAQCQANCKCPVPACAEDPARTTFAGRSACSDLTDQTSCMSAYEMGDGARALACDYSSGSCTGCDHSAQAYNSCTNTCLCGNNLLDPGEECDGAAANACPGQCQSDCRCPPPPCTQAPGRSFVGWVASANTPCAQINGNQAACEGAYFVDADRLATSCYYGSDANCHACQGIAVDSGECTNACLCGNNVVDGLEDCDGTDDSLCPGQCGSDCRCQ